MTTNLQRITDRQGWSQHHNRRRQPRLNSRRLLFHLCLARAEGTARHHRGITIYIYLTGFCCWENSKREARILYPPVKPWTQSLRQWIWSEAAQRAFPKGGSPGMRWMGSWRCCGRSCGAYQIN